MSADVITFNDAAALSNGLAVFYDVDGTEGNHFHWAHQITMNLKAVGVDCLCTGHTVSGPAVFVPAGLVHKVDKGHYLNLFIDPLSRLAEAVLGTEVIPECAVILDREIVAALQSCFHSKDLLAGGVRMFKDTFVDFSSLDNHNEQLASEWATMIQTATAWAETGSAAAGRFRIADVTQVARMFGPLKPGTRPTARPV